MPSTAFVRHTLVIVVVIALAASILFLRERRMEKRFLGQMAEVALRVQKTQSAADAILAGTNLTAARINGVQTEMQNIASGFRSVEARLSAVQTQIERIDLIGRGDGSVEELLESNRKSIILYRSLRQAEHPLPILLGDSIAARAEFSAMVNVAFGGARFPDMLAVIAKMKSSPHWSNVGCLVVAAGVNDAAKSDGFASKDRIAFVASTIEAIRQFVNNEKPIVFVSPLITGKGDVANRFDNEAIFAIRELLLAKSSKNETIVDAQIEFREAVKRSGHPYENMFVDGVHLNEVGYEIWTPIVEASLKHCPIHTREEKL